VARGLQRALSAEVACGPQRALQECGRPWPVASVARPARGMGVAPSGGPAIAAERPAHDHGGQAACSWPDAR